MSGFGPLYSHSQFIPLLYFSYFIYFIYLFYLLVFIYLFLFTCFIYLFYLLVLFTCFIYLFSVMSSHVCHYCKKSTVFHHDVSRGEIICAKCGAVGLGTMIQDSCPFLNEPQHQYVDGPYLPSTGIEGGSRSLQQAHSKSCGGNVSRERQLATAKKMAHSLCLQHQIHETIGNDAYSWMMTYHELTIGADPNFTARSARSYSTPTKRGASSAHRGNPLGANSSKGRRTKNFRFDTSTVVATFVNICTAYLPTEIFASMVRIPACDLRSTRRKISKNLPPNVQLPTKSPEAMIRHALSVLLPGHSLRFLRNRDLGERSMIELPKVKETYPSSKPAIWACLATYIACNKLIEEKIDHNMDELVSLKQGPIFDVFGVDKTGIVKKASELKAIDNL